MIIDLPDSWITAALEEVVPEPLQNIVDGPFGSNLKAREYQENGIPIIRLQNIDRNRFIEKNIKFISEEKAHELERHNFISGDIAITKLGDPLGKAAIIPTTLARGIVVADIVRIRIDPNFAESRFVTYAVNSPLVIKSLETEVKGTTRPRVNLGHIRRLRIPFAPLNEQRRIADQLDMLFARIDICRERLEALPLILKRFRQAILAAATSGQLTEDWRKREGEGQQDSVLELLASIQTRRKQLYEQLYEKAKKEERRKPAPLKIFPDLEEQESDLPEIPSDWRWISFGELIASFRSGSAEVPKDAETEYPILRSSSVRPGSVDLEDVRFLTEAQSTNKDNFLQEGDLLFTRLSGSLEYVANCAIVRSLGNRKVQYPDRLFCAQLVDRHLTPYSEICFGSPILRKFITVEAKSSAGHQRISMSAITDQPIPLPPLGEQHEIARRVKVLFAFADRLETRYSMLRSQVEDLTPALLAKAFRGELVPQDPNDEPASVLLERVRAGQALAEEAKTRRRQIRGRAKLKTKSKAEVIMLNRKDVQLSHLSIILKTRGPLTAEDLWSSSQLEIDDFYDQLKDEEANGLLKEIKKDDPGVQRLLEAA